MTRDGRRNRELTTPTAARTAMTDRAILSLNGTDLLSGDASTAYCIGNVRPAPTGMSAASGRGARNVPDRGIFRIRNIPDNRKPKGSY